MILPNLAAGCSMADMADLDSVYECWEELEELSARTRRRRPAGHPRYLHELLGRTQGLLRRAWRHRLHVLECRGRAGWAFERGQKVLFFPDQHLGRNTGNAMGVPLDKMRMWNPRKDLGGNDEQTLLDSRVILWHGFCSVHKRFNVGQIDKARAEFPGVQVIVHPECPMEVVDAADAAGSTDFIRKAIAAATEPTTFAVGTEINLVNRLGRGEPAAHHLLPGPGDLPVLHHVPHPPRLPRLGPGGTCGRRSSTASPWTTPSQDNAKIALERMLAARPAQAARDDDSEFGGPHPALVVATTQLAGCWPRRRSGAVDQRGTRGQQHLLRPGRDLGCAGRGPAPGDTVAAHIADTLKAGAGLNEEAVRVLCTEARLDIAGLGRFRRPFRRASTAIRPWVLKPPIQRPASCTPAATLREPSGVAAVLDQGRSGRFQAAGEIQP